MFIFKDFKSGHTEILDEEQAKEMAQEHNLIWPSWWTFNDECEIVLYSEEPK